MGCAHEVPAESFDSERATKLATAASAEAALLCGARERSPDALLRTGHSSPFLFLAGPSGDRLLGWNDEEWTLWDTAGRRVVAAGAPPVVTSSTADLAGGMALVPTAGGVALLDARDARVIHPSLIAREELATDGALDAALARDGSYAWKSDSVHGLTAIRLDGTPIATIPDVTGRYRSDVWAGPSVLRAVYTPVPELDEGLTATIRSIDIPTGEVRETTGPIGGFFRTWFQDGEHFVIGSGNEDRVYTWDGRKVQTLARSTYVGGYGRYVWQFGGDTVLVYRLGVSEPVARLSLGERASSAREDEAVASGSEVAFPSHVDGVLFRLALGGPEPVLTQHRVGDAPLLRYASDGAGHWVTTSSGALYDSSRLDDAGRPLPFGCGAVTSIAAAETLVAVGTGDATVRVFDTRAPNQPPLLTLPYFARSIRLSSDARVLLVTGPTPPSGGARGSYLRAFRLPDGELLGTWSPEPNLTSEVETLSADGRRIARVLCSTSTRCFVRVTDLQMRTQYETEPVELPMVELRRSFLVRAFPEVALSPSGERLAFSWGHTARWAGALYERGVRTQSIAGRVGAWTDEQRLLIAGGVATTHVDLQGTLLATLPHTTGAMEVLDAGHVFLRDSTAIVSLAEGKVVWTAPDLRNTLAVTTDTFVYVRDRELRVASWR